MRIRDCFLPLKRGMLDLTSAGKEVIKVSDEFNELMGIMKDLKEQGKSILFITHKLNEIKQVADRRTVLRKGKYVAAIEVKDTSGEERSKLMVGRQVDLIIELEEKDFDQTVLSIRKSGSSRYLGAG